MILRHIYFALIFFVGIFFILGSVFAEQLLGAQGTTQQDEISMLYILPLAEYTEKNGVKSFSIVAKGTRHRFSKSIETSTLSYNDENSNTNISYLGPTIMVNKGDKLAINVKNNLEDVTTLHQHGIHLPSLSDGSVFHIIKKGEVWTSSYTVVQNAATFWYHPHAHKATGWQVSQGLVGMLIVNDATGGKLGLPRDYGVDDIPLIVQDKDFYDNRILYEIEGHHTTYFGNIGEMLVTNGRVSPRFRSTRSLIRLRLLNASTFATQTFSFSDQHLFYLIANDAGLLDKPYEMRSIMLAPSERREILVDISDLSPQEEIHFISNVHNIYEATALIIEADFAKKEGAVPSTLIKKIDPTELSSRIVKKREFILGGYNKNLNEILLTINSESFDIDKVNLRVLKDSVEEWTITVPEDSEVPHSFHPHFGSFRIVSFNDKEPTPIYSGLKDSIFLYPGESAKIVMEFDDYAGLYLFHCHQLEHEDQGMMGVFEVYSDFQ